ncbi:hypothetical protein CO151_02785 [bacterium CG_4_9_14_3_um_filter_65_15]|nr:MAG: hypothetical protein CO151_02785 [bacterium CG_4_9_14_3_um_filter_65_15]
MRFRFLLACILTVMGTVGALAFGASPSHHARVEVLLTAPSDQAFIDAHLDQLDVISTKRGVAVQLAASPDDLELLRTSGLRWRILDRDMENIARYADKGSNFGIFHTFSESAAFLDSLRVLYPQVVSAKYSIGQSGEGREIFAVRLSDNPDVDENEPEILIDCLHHAREVMASEFGIMFAEYLAQNYGSDPQITWLLDNRELSIVPIVNPDGFVYNETTDPGGGGMWRKTRRNNGDGTFGVDPNRNYPYEWGYDNSGSSGSTSSETYRGPFAASEPEVQTMMAFIDAHDFMTGNSVHTFSNLTLYPWGYTSGPTSDDAIFDQLAAEMTRYNGYTPGQPGQVLYNVNGGSLDWNYAATAGHPKMFSFSNEIGGGNDGFWPPESRRRPLFEENIWPNILLMRAAGPFVTVSDPVATASVPAKVVNPGEAGYLDLTVTNQSAVSSTLGGTLHLGTNDPWVQFTSATAGYGALVPMATATLGSAAFPFSVDPGCPSGHTVDVTVTVSMPGGDLDYPLHFVVGQAPAILADDLESGTGNWTLTGSWATTTAQAHSPTHSLTDSPAGNYGDNASSAAILNGTWPATRLEFWTAYALEDGYDYGYVQISAAGGPWLTLGSFTGTQASWIHQDLDLSAFGGQDIAVRFALTSDGYVVDDGMYIDDVVLYGDSGTNQAPSVPEVLAPAGTTTGLQAELSVGNSTDPEGDTLTYGFRVYSDAEATQIVATTDGIPAGSGSTAWTTPELPAGDYWWRAYAADTLNRSSLSAATGFTAGTASGVPLPGTGTPSLEILAGVTGSGTRLRLTQTGAGPVRVDVFDMRGRRVRRLASGTMTEGRHELFWDGRDDQGTTAASGLYLVRAVMGETALTGRVTLVR